jgi:3-oxoadipate enol-lactonase
VLDYTLHRSGRPEAPRLVLLHSLGMDRSMWDGVVAELRGEADILTYDARGHGVSFKPPGPYTTGLVAADLADVLAAAGWDRAIVAGASMGGSIARQFAISYPHAVSGLGLIDTTAWYGDDAAPVWRERGRKAVTDGFASMVAFQQTRWFADAFRAQRGDLVERYTQIFVRNDPAAYAAACDMLGNFDLRAGLAAIAVPAEVLVAEEDYATPPEMARVLAEGIAGARLTIVPNARHLTPIEVPERVAALLRAVVARSEAAVADRR